MKTKIISFSLLLFLIFPLTKAQQWEFVGLDSMLIRQLYVFSDTIYAGTAVRNGFNINAGLYFSKDNGLSWIQLDNTLGNGSITDIEFSYGNRDTFYLVKGESPYSMGGKLFKTIDGGTSWQIIAGLKDKYINWFEISNFDRNELYALERIGFPAGQLESLYRSTNAGITWEEIGSFPSDSHGNNVSVALDLLNDSTLYAAVGTALLGDYFYKSANKGESWIYISEPPGIASDMFTDDYQADRIYLNMVYASFNGGYNWIEIDSGFVQDTYYLSFYQDIKTTNLLYTLRTDGLYFSDRSSFFWIRMEGSEVLPLAYGIGGFTTSDRGLMKNIVIARNSNKIYVGTGYGIYKRDYVSEVINSKRETVDNFNLGQNYPNPFNPSTQIRYSVVKDGLVSLKVYDVLGREIATLVNEQQQPGSYEIKWDASDISSGIYFYQFKTKDYVDTKKMILLK